MSPPQYRRRKIVIHPSFQLRSAIAVFFFLVVYSGVLGFLIFYPIKLELDRVTDPQSQMMISAQILTLHRRVWPGVLAVSVLVGAQILFISHRIAGPLYRVRVSLEQLVAGNPTVRVKLRKHDNFAEFEPLVNTIAEQLETQKSKLERLATLASSQQANLQEIRSLASELLSVYRSETKSTS